MKNLLLIALTIIGFTGFLSAQKYFTKEGKISFNATTPLEKIEGLANTASSVLDIETGKVEFAVLVKSFQFEKALMQEHFNENYMESSKFPKAIFKGQLADASKINFSKDGTYSAKITGDLTIHGVTKPITTEAKFTVKGGVISAQSSLKILIADYDIKIPSLVRDNIAKEAKIDVKVDYQPLKS